MKTLKAENVGSSFTGLCQEKSVSSQELIIYPYFGKFWGSFPH